VSAALVFALWRKPWRRLAHTDQQTRQLLGAVGVGVASSVIPYVCDQLAMARLKRATYSLLVSLLPATATVAGVIVLGQLPTPRDLIGVGLIIVAVAVHREHDTADTEGPTGPPPNDSWPRCSPATPS
jgi:inner membrane transporter RhtA